MLRFQPNPLSIEAARDVTLWLAKPEAQLVREICDAKIVDIEVRALAAAADTIKEGRAHNFKENELIAGTARYRTFLDVLDELREGQNLFTGQVSISK